jgi:DNA (cytosine-5)-methyltransferase 1
MGLPPGWTGLEPIAPIVRERHWAYWFSGEWCAGRPRLRTVSLFSGIAALDLGLAAWCAPVAFVEKDAHCQEILRARQHDNSLPKAPIFSEAAEVHFEPGFAQGVIAGFPCIDNSVAGNRAGLQGQHTPLVRHCFRVADELQAEFLFLENVAAIRSMTSVWTMLFAELARRGFHLSWVTLSASQVGLPHRRRRWFLLAHRGLAGRALFEPSAAMPAPVLPAEATAGRPLVQEWLQRGRGGDARWRLRALGNAVVPAQAFWAASWLWSEDSHAQRRLDS